LPRETFSFDDYYLGVKITADADIVQRVIYNLLSNAFKYANDEVRFNVECAPDGLCMVVEDDGRGLSAEEAERIFDPFYQTSDGVKAGGTGLGLNIVKSFVTAHGGEVAVEPGLERGARFKVRIPTIPEGVPGTGEPA
ncbi:MAG TPA: HAMP domain-containing sensor histidine kinase, partial [Gammaproteobacteria bacterium]|nr:HAMP domain-containing sensor histidine kinase [Gammaproteobacteria bacterium]